MERWFNKSSAAVGSGVPDTSTSAPASTSPVPQPAFENKPPPGQRGPKGLSGRQTYSRANTGAPPVPDAGQAAQKTMAPLGAQFLPQPKLAHLETHMPTTAMPQPSLQDFVKTAMSASAAKVDLSLEAARQLTNNGDAAPQRSTEKTASAQTSEQVPTDYIDKLASAIDYVAGQLKVAQETAADGPGKGPNALETNQGKLPTEDNIDANQTGQATQGPPMAPGTEKLPGQKGDPGHSMQTNESMSHPEQPVEPISNEKTTVSNEGVKAAQAAYVNNLIATGLLKVAATPEGIQLIPLNDLVKEALLSEAGQYAGSTLGGAVGGGAGGAVKGGLAGAAGGGLLGAAGGGLAGLATGGLPGAALGALGVGALGAAAGGVGGAAIGGAGGAAKGGWQGLQRARAGGKALAAQQAAQAEQQPPALQMPKAASVDPRLLARNLMAVGLFKQAEDALSPATVSAGSADATGATPPTGAAPAEQGVPAEPSDVTSQKSKMLSSNDAAINYTKRDAKADPKSDMGDVLKEPAQTKATDKVLEQTLEHDGGNKISSITRVASARAIIAKLAEEQKVGKGKKKMSMGGAPSTASEASGFSASSTM